MNNGPDQSVARPEADLVKPRRSFVIRISAIYLLLTLVNLIVFWTFTGANQMNLITEKALIESRLFADELQKRLQPFVGSTYQANLLKNKQTSALVGNQVKKALTKGDQVLLKQFQLLSSDGRVLYSFGTEGPVDSQTVRLVYKSLQLKEQKAKSFLIEPDTADYSAAIVIPLVWLAESEVIFHTNIQLDTIKTELTSLLYLAVGMVLFLLFIQGIFGFVLYRSLVSPLRRLVEGANRVAQGDYKTEIDNINREDEIHHLINTFNSMVTSINDKTIELNDTIKDLDAKDKVIQKELTMAQSIQKGIMPQQFELSDKIAAAIYYSPLEKVSGDYYDFFKVGDSIGILMADASGHGVPAALITIMAKFYFSTLASGTKDPAKLFYKVNERLTKSLATTDYLTAFYGILQKNLTFTYCNASHENTLILRGGRITELKGEGFMIGAVKDPPIAYKNQKAKLKLGDRLIFYTDGIIEAENKNGTAYGHNRFRTAIKKYKQLPIAALKTKLKEDVLKFTKDARRFDDFSIIIIEIKANQRKIKQAEGRASKLFKKKSFAEAGKIYEQLIAEEPLVDRYKSQLALCYFHLEDFAKAMPLFDELSRREKPTKTDFTYLAHAYMQLEKPILAIKSLQRALVHFPKAFDVIKNISTLFIVQKDRHAALRHIEMLDKLRKNSPDVKKLRQQLKEL